MGTPSGYSSASRPAGTEVSTRVVPIQLQFPTHNPLQGLSCQTVNTKHPRLGTAYLPEERGQGEGCLWATGAHAPRHSHNKVLNRAAVIEDIQ